MLIFRTEGDDIYFITKDAAAVYDDMFHAWVRLIKFDSDPEYHCASDLTHAIKPFIVGSDFIFPCNLAKEDLL